VLLQCLRPLRGIKMARKPCSPAAAKGNTRSENCWGIAEQSQPISKNALEFTLSQFMNWSKHEKSIFWH
jgi:hypothetical protein